LAPANDDFRFPLLGSTNDPLTLVSKNCPTIRNLSAALRSKDEIFELSESDLCTSSSIYGWDILRCISSFRTIALCMLSEPSSDSSSDIVSSPSPLLLRPSEVVLRWTESTFSFLWIKDSDFSVYFSPDDLTVFFPKSETVRCMVWPNWLRIMIKKHYATKLV